MTGRDAGHASDTHIAKLKKKNMDFCSCDDIEALRDFQYSLNQPPKLTDDYYIGVLKNIRKT